MYDVPDSRSFALLQLSFDYVGRTPNHFETLGVRIDATSTQVKMAYRAISLKHHPDKNPDDKNAGEKFIKYQAAYEVLKDASRRDAYNKFGSADSQADDTGSKLMSLSLFYVIWVRVHARARAAADRPHAHRPAVQLQGALLTPLRPPPHTALGRRGC